MHRKDGAPPRNTKPVTPLLHQFSVRKLWAYLFIAGQLMAT